MFVFNDIAFGHDTIAGFDAVRDTIQLPYAIVASLATLNSEEAQTATGGTLINPQRQSVDHNQRRRADRPRRRQLPDRLTPARS